MVEPYHTNGGTEINFDFASVFQYKKAYNFQNFSPVPYQYLVLSLATSDKDIDVRDKKVNELIELYNKNPQIKRIKDKITDVETAEKLSEDGKILADFIMLNISNFASVDEEWRAKFHSYLRNFYELQKYDALYFCEQFLKTLFLISHDKEGQKLENRNCQNEFEKFRSVINLNCFGGAIGAVEEYYQKVKFPASFWVELRSKLTLELSDYCFLGNERHLPAWLDYAIFADRGRDMYFYQPSIDMTYGQINDFFNKMSFGISDIFIAHYDLYRRCYEVLSQTKSEDDDELMNEIFQSFKTHKQFSDLQDEEKVAAQKRKISDEILIKMNLVELAKTIRDKAFEDAILDIEREVKSGMTLVRQSDDLRFEDKNYQKFFCNLVEALNVVKVFAIKGIVPQSNKVIPWWLQDKILEFVDEACKSGYLEYALHEKESFEELIIALAQKAQDIGGYKISFEPDSIKVAKPSHNLSLQKVLDFGGDFQDVSVAQQKSGNQKFNLDIRGLLFNPEQRNILDFLEQNGHELNYFTMLKNAIIRGDCDYVFDNLSRQDQRDQMMLLLGDLNFIQFVSIPTLEDLHDRLLNPFKQDNREIITEIRKTVAQKYIDNRNYPKVVYWLEEIAQKGDADAQISLAYIYQNDIPNNAQSAEAAIYYYNLYYQNQNKAQPTKIKNKLDRFLIDNFTAAAAVSEKWFDKALQIWNSNQKDVSEVVAFVEHVIANNGARIENQHALEGLVRAVFADKCWPDNPQHNFLRAEYEMICGKNQEAASIYYSLAMADPLHFLSLQKFVYDNSQRQFLSPQEMSALNDRVRQYLLENDQLQLSQRVQLTNYITKNTNDNFEKDSLLIMKLKDVAVRPYALQVNRAIGEFCQKYHQYDLWTKTCLEAIFPNATEENYAYNFSQTPHLSQIALNDTKVDAIFKLAELFLDNRAFKTMPRYMSFDLDIFAKVISFCAQHAEIAGRNKSRACAIYGRFLYEGFSSAYYNRNIPANRAESIPYLELAMGAENPDPNVINCIANQYYYGGYGYEKNYELALELYEQAARLGSSEAQYNAGYCYNMKIGTPADLSDDDAKIRARDYLNQAVENDAPSKIKAQTLLRSLDHPHTVGVAVNAAMNVGDTFIGLGRRFL